ncbi:MAG: 50S ribosomal protein L6 [Candidatus Omnitrophica bacterium]|nr:50S ribosomal protein L6 [Candidatus Omnitrophota bacterium]
MSRIGKKPIEVPKNVKVSFSGSKMAVEGPKGKLEMEIHPCVKAEVKDNHLTFHCAAEQKAEKALHGTTRSIAAGMIRGVTEGFAKELLIEGVGFKAQIQGGALSLSLGFTHPVVFQVPPGISVEAPKPTQVFVRGMDKVKVGEFAAGLRRVFEAEPYKGKGIRYLGEAVRRKAGKAAAKA